MEYIHKTITITFDASAYITGDYCNIHSNSGSGAVNYSSPHDPEDYPMTLPQNTAGFGSFDFASQGAFGTGYNPMSLTAVITTPGSWTFSIVAYDKYDNVDVGTPGEQNLYACLTPVRPDKMTVVSYDSATDILTLNI